MEEKATFQLSYIDLRQPTDLDNNTLSKFQWERDVPLEVRGKDNTIKYSKPFPTAAQYPSDNVIPFYHVPPINPLRIISLLSKEHIMSSSAWNLFCFALTPDKAPAKHKMRRLLPSYSTLFLLPASATYNTAWRTHDMTIKGVLEAFFGGSLANTSACVMKLLPSCFLFNTTVGTPWGPTSRTICHRGSHPACLTIAACPYPDYSLLLGGLIYTELEYCVVGNSVRLNWAYSFLEWGLVCNISPRYGFSVLIVIDKNQWFIHG